MTDGVSIPGICAAIALPWLAGTLSIRLAAGPRSTWAAQAGYGFFIGQIMVIALLLAWNATGSSLAFWPAAAVIAILIAAISTVGIRNGGSGFIQRPGLGPDTRPGMHWTAWVAVLALLAMILARFALMAEELLVRPLFAWDAWMNWVPRAIVWFHHLELTPFVAPPDWLAAPVGEEVYTLGNRQASDYPPGVPLLLLWTMLGAGTTDHSLIYLPWLLAPIAFALLLWSALRAAGATPASALVAVYLFISLPLVNVHTMLAGYADFWLALFFCAGAIALDAFQRTRARSALLLAAAMAVGCMLMKTPGLVFGGLILGGAALAAPFGGASSAKTTVSMPASTAAPRHIAHGSNVVARTKS